MREIIHIIIASTLCVLVGIYIGWVGSSIMESKARIKLDRQEASKLICEKKTPAGQLCIIKAVPKRESR